MKFTKLIQSKPKLDFKNKIFFRKTLGEKNWH